MKITTNTRANARALRASLAIVATLATLSSACGGGGGGGSAGVAGEAAGLPAAFYDEAAAAAPEGQIVYALKFVSYVDEAGAPVIGQDKAVEVIRRMNELFAPCNVRFRGEKYEAIDPNKLGLEYSTSSMSQLDDIRKNFDEDERLVVINTGKWDPSQMGVANAWTMMPGQTPSGAVLEADVADDSEIVAHEVGHYLGLDHENDKANMMNPVIYKTSTTLRPDQCETVRKAANDSRKAAVRTG